MGRAVAALGRNSAASASSSSRAASSSSPGAHQPRPKKAAGGLRSHASGTAPRTWSRREALRLDTTGSCLRAR
eukprot:1307186-Rhodomonas_salina.1